MDRVRVVYVDAFTTVPFAGNPCAVLPDGVGLSDEQMQAIARETNLSETSFVLPSSEADFRVRYFTPRSEIPFAGHPTIATVFMLAEEGIVPLEGPVTRVSLEFGIGVLPVDVHAEDGQPVQVVMTQPPPIFGQQFTAGEVAPCLGLRASNLRADCAPQVVSTGVGFLMVPVVDVEGLGRIAVDRGRLADLCRRAEVPAAFAFSLGGFGEGVDTHARFLDPHGTAEDPYTGSAAGGMGAYVVRYGLRPGPTLVAEQGHFVGRPGLGTLEIEGLEDEITAVRLGGAAVRVMEGMFLVDGLGTRKGRG